MKIVGKIDQEIYRCITDDIAVAEVIITDERISHIDARHPGDYALIEPYLPAALDCPDYILQDGSRSNTGLILKSVSMNGLRFQVVLRLQTSIDPAGYYNSIISAWQISESRWNNYLKNKKILYSRE